MVFATGVANPCNYLVKLALVNRHRCICPAGRVAPILLDNDCHKSTVPTDFLFLALTVSWQKACASRQASSRGGPYGPCCTRLQIL